MTVSEQQIRSVVDACRTRLGDPSGWVPPDAYRRSLALCIIESVQAAGTRLADAGTVVDRYLAYRRAHDTGPVTDGARTLLRTFEEAGSADQWAGKVGNYRRRYTESAPPLRAGEIQRTAERLHGLRIDSVPDLTEAMARPPLADTVRAAWDESSGTCDDTTWQHLLLLAGVPDAADPATTAVTEFVRTATEDDPSVSESTDALVAAAGRLGVSPAALEHAVRRWHCTREDHVVSVA
ncbi:heme peroxidase [Prescottella subtropica]|uniref:heme peroxidase n=1 Tax=Prescottella subtropica TaxID=2545757 RepID=UPI0010F49964|nr:heme peroxidase [Prescottella subtropica]